MTPVYSFHEEPEEQRHYLFIDGEEAGYVTYGCRAFRITEEGTIDCGEFATLTKAQMHLLDLTGCPDVE